MAMNYNLFLENNNNSELKRTNSIEMHNNMYNSPYSNYNFPPIGIFTNNEITSDISTENIINQDDNGNVTTMIDDNNSYINSYKPILDELNKLNIETKEMMSGLLQDISIVRGQNSKNKYNNLSNLISASTSLASTRLNIIKEAGNIISNSHNMDLKRYDKTTANSQSNMNEDALVMDLYQMISNNSGNSNIIKTSDIVQQSLNSTNNFDDENISKMYSDYVNELNMINSEIVVVYNNADDTLNFSAIDMNGNFIDNPNIPEKHYLSNIVLDRVNMIAKDKHLGTTYKLIIINDSIADEEMKVNEIF